MENILAHCVVAADGVHSSVRQLLGLAPADDSGVNVVRAVVDYSMCPPLLSMCRKKCNSIVPISLKLGDTSFFTAFNFNDVYEGKVRWTFITKIKLSRDSAECKSHVINEMQQYLDVEEGRLTQGGWEAGTSSTPDSTAKASDISMASCIVALTFPCNMNVARISTTVLGDDDATAWGGRGRVTLIGDAAHAMRAVSGQGSSMAFEDVCVLTRALRGGDVIAKHRCRPFSAEVTIVEERTYFGETTADSGENTGPPSVHYSSSTTTPSCRKPCAPSRPHASGTCAWFTAARIAWQMPPTSRSRLSLPVARICWVCWRV